MHSFKFLPLSLFVLCTALLETPSPGAPSAAEPPGPPGPVTTDADILSELKLDAPGMEKVKAAVQGNAGLQAIQEAYLDYRRHACPAKWSVMPSGQPAPSASDDADGDDICRHYIRNYFYHFDPEAADMGKDFNWTFNPTPANDPGFTNEFTWCAISRCQFWKKLVDAYWKTGDQKYAVEWVAELNSFATKNRFDTDGRNGRVTMWRTLDASERMADSWPYAYAHCLNSPAFTPEAQWLYLKLIRDHATCLANGLDHPERSGNWVATECFGLYSMGVLFPELKDAETWRQTALNRITLEMNRMVPPDGMEAELTPSYHMVSLDGFLGPMKLAKLNGLPVPDAFKEKILAMYRALVTVMDQTGNDVPTNDCTNNVNAARLAQKALQIGDDPVLAWAASGMTTGQPLPDSTMLPYAGFYAMRSGWKPDDMFLFFRAGPTGMGHQHEDMLEVVLRAWGKTLLLDPGSYLYDQSEWRRFTINTPSHSTIIVDGKWQHRGPSKIPVEAPMNNPWVTTPLYDYVAGIYDGGYQKNAYNPHRQFSPETWIGEPDHSITHTRRILYLRPYYALVLDTLDGTGSHTYDALFQLDAPAAHVDEATQAAFSDNKEGVQLGLYPLDRENLAVDVVRGQKDPMLGWYPAQHRPIPTIRFEKKQEAPAIFATLLYPYRGSSPSIGNQPLAVTGDDAWGETLNTPKEKAEIVLVKKGMAEAFSFQSTLVGAVQMNAAGFLARQPAGVSGDFFTGGWDISSYSDGTTQFTTDAPANLAIAAQGKSLLIYNGGDKPVTLAVTRPFSQTASLAPASWTQINSQGATPGTAPTLFAPFTSN
jgi:hypothetical protein